MPRSIWKNRSQQIFFTLTLKVHFYTFNAHIILWILSHKICSFTVIVLVHEDMNMLLDEKAIAGNPWFHTCALSAPVKAVVNYSGSLQLFYRLSERFERGTVMAIKTY